MSTKAPSQEIETLKPQVADVIGEAQALVVKDHASSERAGMILSALKAMRKKVAEKILAPAKLVKAAATKTLADLTETFDDPLEAEWLSVKRKLADYLTEQESLRLAEQRKLQEIENARARKKAEDEALLMEAIGEEEAAEEIRSAPVVTRFVEIAKPTMPTNMSQVAVWKWRKLPGFDISKVPPEYLLLNEVMINQIAKAMKSKMAIPGLEAYEDTPTIRVGG